MANQLGKQSWQPPSCPVCGHGRMHLAHDTATVYICVCKSCQTTLSVPKDALSRPASRDNGR